MTGAKAWTNPLRDPRDKRLPRIAGPCGLVIFGVTGDLSRKKLMPAIYDLANRGLLPPGFALTGFARRDWSTEDFGQIVYNAVKEHARTPFRQTVWDRLAEGFRFVQGSFDDDHAFDRLELTVADLDRVRGTGGNHAFYLSIPPERVPGGVQAARPLRPVRAGRPPVAAGRHREAVRARPQVGDRAQRHRQRRLPRGLGVPHRPLPRQGDGAEHPGDALRQPAVRADLERALRRPRADHDGRGHRPRRARGLLRRHRRGARRDPEPPAAAPRVHRDGGAGVVLVQGAARREDQDPQRDPARRPARRDHRARPVHGRLAGRRARAGAQGGARVQPAFAHRDVRGDHLRDQHPPLGGGAVLPAHRQAAGAARHRDRGGVQARAAPAVRRDDDRGARAERVRRAGAARRGRHAAVRVQGAGQPDGGPRRHDGLRLRHRVHRSLARRPTSG